MQECAAPLRSACFVFLVVRIGKCFARQYFLATAGIQICLFYLLHNWKRYVIAEVPQIFFDSLKSRGVIMDHQQFFANALILGKKIDLWSIIGFKPRLMTTVLII